MLNITHTPLPHERAKLREAQQRRDAIRRNLEAVTSERARAAWVEAARTEGGTIREHIDASMERERRQDVARNRAKIAHAASKVREGNRSAASGAFLPRATSTKRPAAPAVRTAPRVENRGGVPDSLVQTFARNYGCDPVALVKAVRAARVGSVIRAGDFDVTVTATGLESRRVRR